MNLAQVSKCQSLLGKLAAACFFLAFLVLFDGLISRFREPLNIFKVLPGETVHINGPLEEAVQDIRQLTVQSSSDQLVLTLEAVHKGYFLGGDMWRGLLAISPQIRPGEYTLTVGIRGKVSPHPLPPYRIIVFPDIPSRQLSYKFLSGHYLGVSPWLIFVMLLPTVLVAFGGVFWLSQKREKLLAQLGQAEVYRVARVEEKCVVTFGLGTAHGVHIGSRLALLDESGQTAGTAEVEETSETDSSARVNTDRKIKPGYIVRLDR